MASLQAQRPFPLVAMSDIATAAPLDPAGLAATRFVLPTAKLVVDAEPAPVNGLRVQGCGAARGPGLPVNRLSLWCLNAEASTGANVAPPRMLVDVWADLNGCRERIAHLKFAPPPGGGVLIAQVVGPLCTAWEVWASLDPTDGPPADASVVWQLGGVVDRASVPLAVELGAYAALNLEG